MTFGFAALAAALLLVLAVVVRFRDLGRQGSIERLMESAFHPGQHCDAFDEFELTVRENRQVLGGYRRDAQALREAGRPREAAEAMAEGCSAISELALGFLSSLAKLRDLARPLVAIAGLDALAPDSFGSGLLRGLVAGGRVVHHLLLTGQERVVWKLRVLGAAFRCGVHLLRRSVRRLPTHDDAWERADVLIRDLDHLGEHALVAARHILLTLDTLERIQGLISPPRR